MFTGLVIIFSPRGAFCILSLKWTHIWFLGTIWHRHQLPRPASNPKSPLPNTGETLIHSPLPAFCDTCIITPGHSVRDERGSADRREERETLQIKKSPSQSFLSNQGLKCEVSKCHLKTPSALLLRNFFRASHRNSYSSSSFISAPSITLSIVHLLMMTPFFPTDY